MIVGNVGSRRRASVGGGGVLTAAPPGEDGVVVEWWVGADDRWHRPAVEITSRMTLDDRSPIVRTATRVPGGDAIGTWWAVRQGRREVAVLDVLNRSGTPFALAVVLRGPLVRDVTVDGETVRVGGVPVLYLPRAPQFVASVPRGGDLLGVLASGGAAPPADGGPASFAGEVEVAVLLPVAHMVHARVAALLGVDDVALLGGRPVLRELPSPEAAARGWDALTRPQAALSLPGETGDRFEEARRALLLWPDLLLSAETVLSGDTLDRPLAHVAAVSSALDRVGATAVSAPLVEAIASAQGLRGGFGRGDDAVAVTVQAVAALAAHARLGGEAARLAPVIAGGLEFLRKRATGGDLAAFAVAAGALRAAGESKAADAALAVWRRAGAPWPVPGAACPPLPARSGGGELVPDDPCRLAVLVGSLLDRAVREDPDGGVALLGGFDETWRGAPVEVHRVPTAGGGALSFAVRWHGARPALLWEVQGDAAAAGRLTCPVLAPGWSTTEPRGETLF